MMRQLDLFGMPEEPKKPEEKPAAAIVVQMPVERHEEPAEPIVEEQALESVVEEPVEKKKEAVVSSYQLQKPDLIFENEKIGIKIKPKVKKEATVDPTVEVVIPAASVSSEAPNKRGRKSIKEIDAESDLTEVPNDEELFSKQYYSISQVAKWFHVNNSLIRYWENEFSILKPRKNRKGDRLFRPEDVKNLQLIWHLLRHKKFTIEGAKEYLKTNKAKADTNMEIIQSLTKFKSFLLELRATLGA